MPVLSVKKREALCCVDPVIFDEWGGRNALILTSKCEPKGFNLPHILSSCHINDQAWIFTHEQHLMSLAIQQNSLRKQVKSRVRVQEHRRLGTGRRLGSNSKEGLFYLSLISISSLIRRRCSFICDNNDQKILRMRIVQVTSPVKTPLTCSFSLPHGLIITIIRSLCKSCCFCECLSARLCCWWVAFSAKLLTKHGSGKSNRGKCRISNSL